MKRNKKQIEEKFDTDKIKRAAVGGALAGASVFGLTHSGNKYVSNPNNGKEQTVQTNDNDEINTQKDIADMAEFMKNHPDINEGKRLKVTLNESQLRALVKEAAKVVLKELSLCNAPKYKSAPKKK